MTHYDALKRFLHFLLDRFDLEMLTMISVIGDAFDIIQAEFLTIKSQIDPFKLTTAGMIADYERFLSLTPGSGDSVAVRIERIVGAIRTKGSLTRSRFENIATGLGYTIGSTGTKHVSIADGEFVPFRAGVSAAGDRVYSHSAGSSLFTVTITGTGVEEDLVLQSLFSKIKMACTDFIYVNS